MLDVAEKARGTSRPWIRLDCEFDHAEWLFDEHFGVRFAWECFLRYVKLRGILRGSTPTVPLKVLAHEFRIPAEHVERLFEVAKAHGAIEEDRGVWYVANWSEYQTPEAERKRKLRTIASGVVRDCPGQDGTLPDICHATETETETTSSVEEGPFQVAERVLGLVAVELGWEAPSRADVQRCLKADSPLQALVRALGASGAAELFLFAHRTWSKPPTWRQVYANRNQLREELRASASRLEPRFRPIPENSSPQRIRDAEFTEEGAECRRDACAPRGFAGTEREQARALPKVVVDDC